MLLGMLAYTLAITSLSSVWAASSMDFSIVAAAAAAGSTYLAVHLVTLSATTGVGLGPTDVVVEAFIPIPYIEPITTTLVVPHALFNIYLIIKILKGPAKKTTRRPDDDDEDVTTGDEEQNSENPDGEESSDQSSGNQESYREGEDMSPDN